MEVSKAEYSKVGLGERCNLVRESKMFVKYRALRNTTRGSMKGKKGCYHI